MLEEPGALWVGAPSKAPLAVALAGTWYLEGEAAALTAALGRYPGRTQRGLSRLRSEPATPGSLASAAAGDSC